LQNIEQHPLVYYANERVHVSAYPYILILSVNKVQNLLIDYREGNGEVGNTIYVTLTRKMGRACETHYKPA